VTIDLAYDPAGPPDKRTLDKITSRRYALDRAYLDHVHRWHGGIPGKGYFTTPAGVVRRIGRFLTLFDTRSALPPPYRPARLPSSGRDARLEYSAITLIDQEGDSCRHLFGGDELLPFAALYDPHDPDEMYLTDGHVDLVCFYYPDAATKKGKKRPGVVLWDADRAREEYWRWEEEMEADDEAEVRYESFTEPIARNFDRFLKMLRDGP
jgi:hypothetical protein